MDSEALPGPSQLSASQAPVAPVPPEEHWGPVAGMSGVVTCPLLRRWSLGIASKWNLLCCLRCNQKNRPVNFTSVREHIKLHHELSRALSTATIHAHLLRFGVDRRQLDEIPVPTGIIAPLPFLERYEVYKCTLCEEQRDENVYFRSQTSRADHFRDVHHISGPPERYQDRIVLAQTFCFEKWPHKTWFEVDPKLERTGPMANLDDEDDPIDATARDLLEAYLRTYTPADRPDLPAEELRSVMPFLHLTGWAQHVQNDVQRLRQLVVADPALDGYETIYCAAQVIFLDCHSEIGKRHEIYRTNVMDDESGNKLKAFHTLTKGSRENYATLFARWVVFICRLRDMQRRGETWYPVDFTDEQNLWADKAIDYNDPSKKPGKKRDIIFGLVTSFWRRHGDNAFNTLGADSFSDPTVRFSCLINILESSEFASPRNCCHDLVRMKLLMRTMLFSWSFEYCDRNQLHYDEAVPSIAGSLSRRKVTPFATICLFASHANTYAKTSTHLPNVAWVTLNTVSVEGHQLELPAFFDHLGAELLTFENHVLDELIFGLDPAVLGFAFDESTDFFDDMSNKTPGHSVFKDPKLASLRFKLAEHAFGSPRARYLHKGQIGTGGVVWDDIGVARYLESWHKALRSLAFAMHVTGGLPARAAEFITLMWENTQFRMRGIFMPAPGRMVFVLWYNKTTGQTGFDSVVVHAIPWQLARLVLLLKAVVAPFVGVLTKHMYGTVANNIHNLYVFTRGGKVFEPEVLSQELRRWFMQHLRCPFGVRLYRQFSVAVSRRLMPGSQRIWRRSQNIIDIQAGHTSETADEHYAIEVPDLLRIAEEGVLMYSNVSWWWWRLVLQNTPDFLTQLELTRGDEAKRFLMQQMLGGYGDANPGPGRFVTERLEENTALLRQIADRLGKALQITGLEGSENERTDVTSITATADPLPRPPPPGQVAGPTYVVGDHLSLLRAYCSNWDASWTCRQQGQAMARIIEWSHSLLVVLPTGAGKSVLFGALPYLEGGITVVVFPLRTLLNDQVAAAAKRDPEWPWHVWHSRLELPNGVVVTTMEGVVRDQFTQWCMAQVAAGRLSRIVIDEVHLVPSQERFRAVMLRLRHLVRGRVPIVGLTATMPPALEGRLRHRLGDPTWLIIRAPTQRFNLHLRTAKYVHRDAAFRSLQVLLQRYKREMADKSGILVIVRSQDEATLLADKLKERCYHSGMANEVRDLLAAGWIQGDFKVIIGTSGLGTGIHHPGCRLVIHWGVPHGMLSYAQETGRAGRAGDPALCILMYWTGVREPDRPDIQGDIPMDKMLRDSRCLRIHLSGYLDGEEEVVSCFSDRFALCDRCIIERGISDTRFGRNLEFLARPPARTVLEAGELPPDLIDLHSALPIPPAQPGSSPLMGPQEDDLPMGEALDIEARSDESDVGAAEPQGQDVTMESPISSRAPSPVESPPRQDRVESLPDPNAGEGEWTVVPYRSRAGSVAASGRQAWAPPGAHRRSSSTIPRRSQAAPGPSAISRADPSQHRRHQSSSAVAGPSRTSPNTGTAPPAPTSPPAIPPYRRHREPPSSPEARRVPSRPADIQTIRTSERTVQNQSAAPGPSRTAPAARAAPPAPTSPPAVPQYRRYREHPSSPQARRQSSRSVDIQPIRALNYAAQNLRPLQRTGSAVTHDSEMAMQRRSAVVDPNQADEDRAGTFSFPNLMALNSVAGNWCSLCLVSGRPWTTHTFRWCDTCRGAGDVFVLEGVRLLGKTFKESRSAIHLPRDETICWFCYWPYGVHRHHPAYNVEERKPRCTVKDFVLPAAWRVLGHPVLAAKVAERFTIDPTVMSDWDQLCRWMGKAFRQGTWADAPFTIYNAQAVLLWLFYEERQGIVPGYTPTRSQD
ncbi:hypothetical protein FRC08_005013 [Ceratobasidium sp. 394]|nr:hypothetical protein FRC08_005013 [Ceratobasidium sp. 394]